MESAIKEFKTDTNDICSAPRKHGISSVLCSICMTISQRIKHTKIGAGRPTVLLYIEEREVVISLINWEKRDLG